MKDLAIVVLVSLGLLLLLSRKPAQVKASDDCLVMDSTPDGKGGSVVVFNCGAAVITIHEPVWP